MKPIIIAALIFFAAHPSHADSIKVLKVKGQKATVVFPKGVAPEQGQTYSLGGDDSGSGSMSGGGSRAHTIALTNRFSSTSSSSSAATSSSTSATHFDVSARFGWNIGILEYGPIVSIDYTSFSTTSSQSLKGGGFLDYNIEPNKAGTPIVYGVGASLEIGQKSSGTSTMTTSSSLFDFFAGGFVKWFGLSPSFCLRGDLGYAYASQSTEGISTTTSGFAFIAGIQAYF